MKRTLRLFPLALLAVFFSVSAAQAQPSAGQIAGLVTDSTSGEPLPGVNVVIAGTQQGTSTAADGSYTITGVEPGTYALRASFVGYATAEASGVTVADGETTTVNFALRSSVVGLEEIVAIGYGEVERQDLTGSVSSVDSSQFNTGIQASVQDLLQSRAPGVRITQTSSEPGGGASVRIRGATSLTAANDPLYVIDGQPISNDASITPGSPIVADPTGRNPLKALNPGDIASIEILKDASATAIYGSRGANGVILITTKKGQEGRLKVEYNGSVSSQEVAKELDFLSAREYMTFLNELRADQGQEPEFTQEEISAAGEGTDWQDQIFRAAPAQNHQLSFSGGSENTQYYASLNYFSQEGVVISSGATRYSGRVNVDHSAGRLDFGVNLATSFLEDDFVPNGVGINAGAGVIAAAHQMDPTLDVRNADGEFTESQVLDLENPVALGRSVEDFAETNRTFGNIFAEYNVFDALNAKVTFGSDRQTSRRDGYINTVTKRGQRRNGFANIDSRERTNYLLELTLNYDKQLAPAHSISAVAGYTYQVFNGRGYVASTADFQTDDFGTDNLSAGNAEENAVGSGRFRNQLLSYLGRVNYSLLDKYLLTASFRIDGSSRFGEDRKFGYFPSAALAWKLSEEPFLADQRVFSNLKLRASYGVTGNQEIGNYNSLVLLGTVGEAVFNDQRFVGIAPIQLGNPDLKWETTRQFNVGLDYGLLGGRVAGSMDYFVKNTSDLLLFLPIPTTSGFGGSLQNVGDTRNSGFEVQIETQNLTGAFSWTTTANLATLSNEVTDLGDLPFILQGGVRFLGDLSILQEGSPINAYYGYEVDGIFQSQAEVDGSAQPAAQPGDLRFRDLNGDGSITPDDRSILGSPFPDVTVGLDNSLSYKGLSLSVFFEGSFGNELLNVTRVDTENPISFRRNRLAYVLDRWTPEDPSSENPSFVNSNVARAINSRVVEDASYIRLKNVRLSYRLPGRLLPGGVQSLSVYGTVQNAFTITDYTGYNPDVSSFGDSNLRVDYNAYPLARTYTMGITLGI